MALFSCWGPFLQLSSCWGPFWRLLFWDADFLAVPPLGAVFFCAVFLGTAFFGVTFLAVDFLAAVFLDATFPEVALRRRTARLEAAYVAPDELLVAEPLFLAVAPPTLLGVEAALFFAGADFRLRGRAGCF